MYYDENCKVDELNRDWIENAVSDYLLTHTTIPDTIFISLENYANIVRESISDSRSYHLNKVNEFSSYTIYTNNIQLKMVPVLHRKNFCCVGTKKDFEILERKRTDEEFEKTILTDIEIAT